MPPGRPPRSQSLGYRPAPGSIPTQPGVYRFRDARGPGDLRRQGEEPAGPAVVVLPGHRRPAPAHGHDGHHRRERRLDRRRDRGRGPPAGVQLDQGVRPALQREVPRRQVLPLAGGHRRRGVPAGDGRARRQAQGHPLLRPLQPRLGDPGDDGPPAAGLPDALLLQRRLQAVRPDRPALPARLHRQVRGALRRQRHRRGAPRDRRRLLRLHGRQHQAVHPAHRAGDVRRLRRRGLRARGPAARRPRRAAARRWRSRPSCSPTAPTPT